MNFWNSISVILIPNLSWCTHRSIWSCTLFQSVSPVWKISNAMKKCTYHPYLHKKGSKQCPSNYRPISSVNILAKTLENAVNSIFPSYLESANIISPEQFGLREKRSVHDSIMVNLNFITSEINKKKYVNISINSYMDKGNWWPSEEWHYVILRVPWNHF